MSELSLFCPYESFRRIDRYSSGEISTEDVIAFCSDNGVYCSLSDATGLIGQYDENNNGRLSYEEYLQLVLPATSPSLRSLATSRDTSSYAPRRAFLNSDVEFYLKNVFEREVEYWRMHSEFKRELSVRGDFTVAAAYDSIDVRHPRGRIDRYEIHDYVRDYYMVMTDSEVDAVIRRCDNDGDEALSFGEFSEAVSNTHASDTAPIANDTMRPTGSPARATFRAT